MGPTAPSRKALALAALETARAAASLLLGSGSGDEGRQPIDAGIIRNHRLRLRLRLRLKLRLRTMFAMAAMFA